MLMLNINNTLVLCFSIQRKEKQIQLVFLFSCMVKNFLHFTLLSPSNLFFLFISEEKNYLLYTSNFIVIRCFVNFIQSN
jgi:hypothetical protein